MSLIQLRNEIFKRYIKPLSKNKERYIGLEIEMPIINLKNKATDQKTAQNTFDKFIKHYDFKPEKIDYNGICYSAIAEDTGDKISFDCSYNVLELSFAKESNIHILQNRFKDYITFLNQDLLINNHLLSGLGINPNYEKNSQEYIPSQRYKMHEYYLSKAQEWNYSKYFHPYYGFLTFTSSSQVHLDVTEDEILDTLNAFSMLEPITALLFSNAVMTAYPNLKNTRDMLWEDSTHGINHHNVGMYESKFNSIDELINYISTMSIYTVIRDDHTIFFQPIALTEYFNLEKVNGEYYDFDLNKVVRTEFIPEMNDLIFVRTYKNEDLTFRGTLELRSCCTQPFSEAMSVAAFYIGLQEKIPEVIKLLEEDNTIYKNGYNSSELRELFIQKNIPHFINTDNLKKLILKVLNLAKEGLLKRELGEEIYLDPLFKRAKSLTAPADFVLEQIEKDNIEKVINNFSDFNNLNPLELKE